jgi:hypothetical protein
MKTVNIDIEKFYRAHNLVDSLKDSLDENDLNNLYWRIGHLEILMDDIDNQIKTSDTTKE